MPRSRSSRGIVAWICSVALALLALGAPLHALAHAQQAASSVSADKDPAAAAQAHACELCLQFAALEGGAAIAPAALPRFAATTAQPIALPAPAARGVEFQAYASRAPPLFE